MSQPAEPMSIRLQLPAMRYAFGIGVFVLIGGFLLRQSLLPTLVRPTLDARAQEIGRMLMSLDRVAGVWPLPAAFALAFLAGALFYVWALVAPRPSFELALDAQGASWPSLAPWRAPWRFAWSEITSVEPNAKGDHVVFLTARGRKVMPAWWLPSGTTLADVIRAAESLRRHATR